MDDFIHVPKAAGTTLRAVMARQYGADSVLEFEPEGRGLHGGEQADALRGLVGDRAAAVLTGHHDFGAHATLSIPVRYFTFLRDPLARAISDYFYAFDYPEHRLRAEIVSGKLSVERFLTDPAFALFDLQCRAIAGPHKEQRDIASVARDILETSFHAFGVSERFDESLLLIAKRMRWKPPLYVTRNVTRLDATQRRAREDAEFKARFRHASLFASDSALHARASELVDRHVRAEGAPFASALAAFLELKDRLRAASRNEPEWSEGDDLPPVARSLVDSEAHRVIAAYLNASDKAPPARNYVGHVDFVEEGAIGGWAIDLWDSRPAEVGIFQEGRLLGTATANEARADVAQDRGFRENVGFRFELPAHVAGPAGLRACFGDTRIEIANA